DHEVPRGFRTASAWTKSSGAPGGSASGTTAGCSRGPSGVTFVWVLEEERRSRCSRDRRMVAAVRLAERPAMLRRPGCGAGPLARNPAKFMAAGALTQPSDREAAANQQ